MKIIMRLNFSLLCIAVFSILTVSVQAAPVKVTGGLVEGKAEDDLMVYRGIPFAAPPQGKLRWQPPQPLNAWQGVLNAEEFGDACPQGRANADGNLADGVSEDCLYLNVWTPATLSDGKPADEKLPVMVWIYGGGFGGGATSTPLYSGEQLAKKGVVYVSVAYRVGVMGFMAHPELSAENKNSAAGVYASGNYGLLDQIAGLQWVQENIAAFGGDPEKVTIFGESAGGIAVSMLAASPLAEGLFRGAISQSGGSFAPPRTPSAPGENIPTLVDAELGGAELGEKLGAPSIAAMREIAPGKVMASARGVNGIGWPILDGWVIPDDQYVLYSKKQYNNVPIIAGINSDEGASFSRTTDPELFKAELVQRFGPFADELAAAYPPEADGSIKQAARDVMREASFGWHTWVWAKLQHETGGAPAYVYFFNQRPPYSTDSRYADVVGVPHAAELAYVFQHLDQYPRPWTQADRNISDAIATYWTNFVKTGNPNGAGLPDWPAFDPQKQMRMVFDGTPHAKPYDNIEQLEAFDKYFAWRRTSEGQKFVERD